MDNTAPELLYQNNKNKTRVLVLSPSPDLTKLILHALSFNSRNVDFLLEDGTENHQENDFFVLEKSDITGAENFHPNIVFAATENSDTDFSSPLKNIVGGGIVVYNENDENLSAAINEIENYFRKISYKTLDASNNLVETEMGIINVNADDKSLKHIEGAKLLCQHLGLMEEDFYEGIMN